jgi:hypothetical protein
MPFTSEWVPPEIFLTHKGVIVYHAYKDNDLSNGKATYWYTMSEREEQEHEFDVRELPTWRPLLEKIRKKVNRPKIMTEENFPILGTVAANYGGNIMNTKSDPKFKKFWAEHAKWQKYQKVMNKTEAIVIEKAIIQAIGRKILKQA